MGPGPKLDRGQEAVAERQKRKQPEMIRKLHNMVTGQETMIL